jgi:protein phosphatase
MTGSGEGDSADRFGVGRLFDSPDFPPPSTTVQVTFGAQSHRGRLAPVNEDHYLILRMGRHQETLMTSLPADVMPPRFDEYGYAMVVADGMGRGGSGEAASRLAIATLVYLVRHFGKWELRVDDTVAQEIIARAERLYRQIDITVTSQRYAGPASADQTTLTATFGSGRDLFFAHVGHSRAYLLRGGDLARLTRDHTARGRQRTGAASPPLREVTVAARDLAHILTDTIGMAGSVGPTIDIERIQLCDDDRVLVCTNGLTDVVDDQQIAEILASEESPDRLCRSLVDLALASNGKDDVTALVARYRIPG